MTDAEHWQHLLNLANRIGAEFAELVFIGGLAVFVHATRIDDARWQEASHDVDCYLSILGKSAMRDHYEMHYSPHLHKDSVRIEDEDFDVYTEHQHHLAIPYSVVAAHSHMIEGLRVASLEHLIVLKADAALDRAGSSKGEKDLRDLARILILLRQPNDALILPYLSLERQGVLQRVVDRVDVLITMGFNVHEVSRYRQHLTNTVKKLLESSRGGG